MNRVHAVCAGLAVALVGVACTATPGLDPKAPAPPDQSVLRGWQHCTDEACGKNFISVYSTFVFLQLDDARQDETPVVVTTPGRHWVEAFYSWGAGVIIGVGNYRNYAFEIDLLPGHTYQIDDVPSGCIVPAFKHWVSPKTLRVIDIAPSGDRAVQQIKAVAYCTPASRSPGSCRQDSDCQSGACTPFEGSTGHGLCGEWRP